MIIINGFKVLLLIATLISFVFFPTLLRAEYYLVCDTPTYSSCKYHHVHKKYKKHYTVKTIKHKPIYKKRSSYRIEVYYVYPQAPCGGCSAVWAFPPPPPPMFEYCVRGDNYSCVDFSSQPYAYTESMEDYYYYNEDYYYNPDMATGDDDSMIYPDLQINN